VAEMPDFGAVAYLGAVVYVSGWVDEGGH
jgi:hypothetical protein